MPNYLLLILCIMRHKSRCWVSSRRCLVYGGVASGALPIVELCAANAPPCVLWTGSKLDWVSQWPQLSSSTHHTHTRTHLSTYTHDRLAQHARFCLRWVGVVGLCSRVISAFATCVCDVNPIDTSLLMIISSVVPVNTAHIRARLLT